MVKSYVEWAKRENAKLHAKRAVGDVKEKLLQKLSKLKPSDLKNTSSENLLSYPPNAPLETCQDRAIGRTD